MPVPLSLPPPPTHICHLRRCFRSSHSISSSRAVVYWGPSPMADPRRLMFPLLPSVSSSVKRERSSHTTELFVWPEEVAARGCVLQAGSCYTVTEPRTLLFPSSLSFAPSSSMAFVGILWKIYVEFLYGD